MLSALPVAITPRNDSLVAARSNPDLTFLAAGGDIRFFGEDLAKGTGSKGEKQIDAKSTRKLNRNGGR